MTLASTLDDRHRVPGRAGSTHERERVKGPGKFVHFVLRQVFEILVLNDVDPMHSDPDDMTRERPILMLTGYRLDRPGIGPHTGDLALGEPARRRLARARLICPVRNSTTSPSPGSFVPC